MDGSSAFCRTVRVILEKLVQEQITLLQGISVIIFFTGGGFQYFFLKTLQEMDVKQMANYLGLDSILNTSDSAKNAIASALMEQFHSCFNYKISSTSVSGYLAEVDAELTTFDSNSILTQYEKELNTYLASADAVIDGSQKRYNKSHELLLDSIRNNQATITATATFHLTNDGASWKLENAGTELGNAIFGTLTASPVPEDSTEDNE